MKFVIAISFALFTLVKSSCIQKEEGSAVKCCDQREHGGPLHCCVGQNSSCGMENFAHNELCFCDEFCETAGDCCPDFESVKEPCGLGTRKSKQKYVLCFSLPRAFLKRVINRSCFITKFSSLLIAYCLFCGQNNAFQRVCLHVVFSVVFDTFGRKSVLFK